MMDLRIPAKMKLANNTLVYIEAVSEAPSGRQAISAETAAEIVGRFESIADSICAVASDLQTALSKVSPNEAEIEFGVDAKVESGGLSALIVKGQGSANFKIKLKWVRAEPE
jgi:ABC-type molybdate transport system substrate-binding protein